MKTRVCLKYFVNYFRKSVIYWLGLKVPLNIIFLKNLLNQTTTPGVGTIIAKSEDTHTDTNTHTLMHTHTHSWAV